MPYDVVVIGGGPAGLTAAIYAVRKKLTVLVLGGSLGGQAALSAEVANYLGFSIIKGPDLVMKFREHVKTYKDIELKEGVRATSIKKADKTFIVETDRAGTFEAKTLILCMGEKPRELMVPGEKEFRGKGVSYCSSCDGPLFHNKDVAIVGGGNSGIEAAIELSGIAKTVHVIQNLDSLTADAIMTANLKKRKNVEVHLETSIKEIRGATMVREMILYKHGKALSFPVQGVFVEIGWVPSSDLVKGITDLNEKGEIRVDKDCQTSVPGIFACGDITDVHSKQIIIAAGEGAKAAISAFKYIITQHDYGNDKKA